MRWAAEAALASVLVVGVTTNGFSATAQDGSAPPKAPAPAKDEAVAAAPTIDNVIGKKLISIDGSLVALTASEGGLAREIVGPNGAVQKTALRFINDKLGTVSDSRDANKVIGVFRMSGADIEIQYADGTSETVLANGSGGISIESTSAGGQPYCTAWYPEGHVFSMEDRKAALAQYASKLGLPDSGDKKTDVPPRAGCSSTPAVHATDAKAKPEPALAEAAARPAVLASAGVVASAKTPSPKASEVASAAPKTSDVAAAAAGHAIDVRTSEVHPIDPAPVAAAAPPPPAQIVASLGANQAIPASAPKGASACLSVDSDGSHWGFRNHCAYTVQFAYCLMSGNPLASCKDGAVAGSVAGNGFGALVADETLKESDAAHDFRWVACQGGAGEVIPRLDQIDPPSGRCVH